MEKVLSCTSCTSKYGCWRWTKPSQEWARVERHVDSDGEEGAPMNGQLIISPALGVPQLIQYGEEVFGYGIDEFRIVLGGQPTPCFSFFFWNIIGKKQCFTLPVVNNNEIVWSTSDGVKGKSGLTCLVRYCWSCWCRRVLQFLVTLDNG